MPFFNLAEKKSPPKGLFTPSLSQIHTIMKETRFVVKLHEVKIWHVRLRYLSVRLERKETKLKRLPKRRKT